MDDKRKIKHYNKDVDMNIDKGLKVSGGVFKRRKKYKNEKLDTENNFVIDNRSLNKNDSKLRDNNKKGFSQDNKELKKENKYTYDYEEDKKNSSFIPTVLGICFVIGIVLNINLGSMMGISGVSNPINDIKNIEEESSNYKNENLDTNVKEVVSLDKIDKEDGGYYLDVVFSPQFKEIFIDKSEKISNIPEESIRTVDNDLYNLVLDTKEINERINLKMIDNSLRLEKEDVDLLVSCRDQIIDILNAGIPKFTDKVVDNLDDYIFTLVDTLNI